MADALQPARRKSATALVAVVVLGLAALLFFHPFRSGETLLNVSYDATREYFTEIDAAFTTGDVRGVGDGVQMSHGGSMRQMQNIIGGLVADVVTLASPADIDEIVRNTGCIAPEWRERMPYDSSPFASTIVFLVRAGNPRQILEWKDLERREVDAMAPDPAVSGGGRLAYLACFGAALRRHDGDQRAAERAVAEVYQRIVLPALGARQALEMFLNQRRADVLLTWENEAHEAAIRLAPGEVEVVYPARSILAEPVVTVIDRFAGQRGTREAAINYVAFLFSPEAQRITARRFLRPRLEQMSDEAPRLPALELFSVEDVFGGWEQAWAVHFGRDGSFARIEELRRLGSGGTE